jgi:hypothetical protein
MPADISGSGGYADLLEILLDPTHEYPTRHRSADPISKELISTSMCLYVPLSHYFSGIYISRHIICCWLV